MLNFIKMMKERLFEFFVVVFCLLSLSLLSGCGSDGGMMPLTDETVKQGADVVKTTSGYTKDASVMKEAEVHKTLRNRDKMIKEAHANSGMKMEWQAMKETVFYPGMAAPVEVVRYMPIISYREKADFNQPLPQKPSDHPVWEASKSWVHDIATGIIWWKGIDTAGSVLKKGFESAGDTVGGDKVQGDKTNGDKTNGDKTTTEILAPE